MPPTLSTRIHWPWDWPLRVEPWKPRRRITWHMPGWPQPTASSANGRQWAGRCTRCLRMRPNFAALVRAEFARWWTADYAENFIDVLRKAGLEVPPGNAAAAPVAG